MGVNLDGLKEVLGLWTAETEGAKFWLQVVTELKNRGIKDIFVACVVGLKDFPEAINFLNIICCRGSRSKTKSKKANKQYF